MTKRVSRQLAFLLLLTSCGGRRIDLGRDGNDADHEFWGNSGDDAVEAVTLYEGSSRVVGFEVDEQRLYVLTEGNPSKLRSCSLSACASTLQTLAEMAPTNPEVLYNLGGPELSSGVLFWVAGESDLGAVESDLWSCPTTGCPSGPHLVTHHHPLVAGTADDQNLYSATETSLLACAKTGCDYPHEVYRRSTNDPRLSLGSPMFDSGYQFVYFSSSSSKVIWRIDRSFTGKEEIVFENQYPIGRIAADPDGLYITVSILAGSVIRCAPDDCEATKAVVAAGQRYPGGLSLNEHSIDWMNMADGPSGGTANVGTIVTCPRADCTQPRTIASLVNTFGYRSNSKSVVWGEHLTIDPWFDRIQVGPR
jgi:hypothetical protein